MKAYTVIWLAAAENELAELWLIHQVRDEIRVAADYFDLWLAKNPRDLGREYLTNLYEVSYGCLQIFYSIYDDDRIVRVHRVKLISP